MTRNLTRDGAKPWFSDVEQQVARILNHRLFARSQGPAQILRHLLRKLAVDGGRPATQQELAGVLKLGSDFDPARNPLVRMHMSKLRRMLIRYVQEDGRTDPVFIEIPRNQYRLQATVNGERFGPAEREPRPPAADAEHRPIVLVGEFASQSDSVGELAADVAFRLVVMLAESPHLIGIGPVLRNRLRGVNLDIRRLAERCGAVFALDGEILAEERGVTFVARMLDVSTGEVCWSDWLDEPLGISIPGTGDQPSMVASRMFEKLQGFDARGHLVAPDSGRIDPNLTNAASV